VDLQTRKFLWLFAHTVMLWQVQLVTHRSISTLREWEKKQYIIIHCNMHQFGKHSKLLINGANKQIFKF